MSWPPPWAADAGRAYAAGATVAAVAAGHHVSVTTARKAIEAAGVPIRSKSDAQRVRFHGGPAPRPATGPALAALLAARAALLDRRDMLHEDALSSADAGQRALAAGRAAGVEEAAGLVEGMIRPRAAKSGNR